MHVTPWSRQVNYWDKWINGGNKFIWPILRIVQLYCEILETPTVHPYMLVTTLKFSASLKTLQTVLKLLDPHIKAPPSSVSHHAAVPPALSLLIHPSSVAMYLWHWEYYCSSYTYKCDHTCSPSWHNSIVAYYMYMQQHLNMSNLETVGPLVISQLLYFQLTPNHTLASHLQLSNRMEGGLTNSCDFWQPVLCMCVCMDTHSIL